MWRKEIMLAWASSRLAENQLGLSGVDAGLYKAAFKNMRRGGFGPTDQAKIVFALAAQAGEGNIKILDRERFLSELLRWECEKGAGWMMCCSLVKALLGEETARQQYPEYDQHKLIIDFGT
jgi:hypothetical protein